ncbi:hypothetical protein [Massilia eurypsychrophila]|nr:hypothetical protein [Massilia eurypsychrophila]
MNSAEMHALQSLDTYRDGDLPQRLFAYNLVMRQPSGATVLTRHGERTLFRQACLAALQALDTGEATDMATGVTKWLLASGFIKEAAGVAQAPSITPRGKLWLASFEADDATAQEEAVLTASDFARRRA